MADITQLTENLNLLNSNITKYIVSPINAFGIGGFVFDIEGESTVNLSTEITDHYTEDNRAIQDHIAVRPKKVTLKNYVGELVYRQDENTDTPAQNLTQKLTVLNSYIPQLAAGAKQASDIFLAAKQASSSFNGAGTATDFIENNFSKAQSGVVNLWNLIKNVMPPTSRQQQAFMFFKALMQQKILISVQTPFEFMSNMAIETITAIQSEESRFISNFSMTLKEIRTVSTIDVPFDPAKLQGRSFTQSVPVTQGGTLQGLTVSNFSNPPVPTQDFDQAKNYQDFLNALPLPAWKDLTKATGAK